jgi:putative tryptophan/tyrosine transport system substrate-binding protein
MARVRRRDFIALMGVAAGVRPLGARAAGSGDLPVVQSAKFEFVLNMRSAKALGLAVPASMQSLADDVIE